MKAHFQTDIGQVRSHNEDSGGVFYNQNGQLLAIVADGMGGHQAGDVASQMATTYIKEKWEKEAAFDSPIELESWIINAIKEANHTVYTESTEKADLEGMGTTVVIAVCTNEFITIAHIGDSRCYLFKDNTLRQITEDHSLVNELVRSGQISADDAEFHPRKNVLLRALGTEESVICDISTLEWEEGHKLLLCSDGLTNKITDEELRDFLSKSDDASAIGEELIALANKRGGEDNISLTIIHHEYAPRAGEEQ